MTKPEILECLNEIGDRFVRVPDPNPEHYRSLGIALGVAWYVVSKLPDDEAKAIAAVIGDLALESGSVQ